MDRWLPIVGIGETVHTIVRVRDLAIEERKVDDHIKHYTVSFTFRSEDSYWNVMNRLKRGETVSFFYSVKEMTRSGVIINGWIAFKLERAISKNVKCLFYREYKNPYSGSISDWFYYKISFTINLPVTEFEKAWSDKHFIKYENISDTW